MKHIDPSERVLEAYFLLTDSQKTAFNNAVRIVERFTTGAFPKYVGTTAEPAPTRGRPKGSKNRAKPAEQPDNIELVENLFGNNGAVAEGL